MTTRELFRPPSPLRALDAQPLSAPRQQQLFSGGAHDAFAWHAPKYLAVNSEITRRAEIEVPSWPGRQVYLVDFLIVVGGPRGRRIAVEIGNGRTLRDHMQRRRRDARLIASGAVDAIYRIAGRDLPASIEDALYLIAAWEKTAGAGRYVPDAFSARGRLNLGRLASREARGVEIRRDVSSALVDYPERPAPRARRRVTECPHLMVRRFDRRFPGPWEPLAPARALPLNLFYRPTGS